MKDYLKKEERLDLLFFKKYIDSCESMIENWSKRNNLTKEEHKALKTAITWGIKAFDSITARQSQQTLKTFWNSIKESVVIIQDRFAVGIYQKKMSSDMKASYEMNKDYFALVEEIMYVNCQNCIKDHKECGFAEEFNAHCLPEPTGFEHGNCRYSYKKEDIKKAV